MAAQLSAQQNAAENNGNAAYQVAGGAQQRALQAMQAAGGLGSSLQAQQFGQQAQKAGANDALAQFNAQLQQQNSQFNTNAGNNAQQFNIGQNNAVNANNAGIMNTAGQFNANANNTAFQDQNALASEKSGADFNNANILNGQGASNAATAGGLISTAGNVLGDAMMMSSGGKIPGKASVPGDSRMNDKVPVMTSPGEVVVPRSIVAHPEKAESFVKHAGSPSDEELLHYFTGYKYQPKKDKKKEGAR